MAAEADYPAYRPYLSALERKPPTSKHIQLTSELEKYIDTINARELPQEKIVREEVLLSLSKLVNTWVLNTLKSKNIPQSANSHGELFVSGSYRLGVNSRNDDVDTICCVPKYLSKDDFFSEEDIGFMTMLKKMPGVTHVNAIREAVVPLIEVVWNGIDLDVLLARLERETVPKLNEILNDRILVGLDDSTVRSINGPRVTEMLIKLVPNYQNFAIVLRCVRKWAKVRGIYSNKLGYLGGVNYAILVAFCCQLYPTASPSKLLQRFFALYCEWAWPTEVRLCHPDERSYLHMKQWDPKTDKSEEFHVMPILTPAYPQQNSSYNVSHSSLDIMLDEFIRAKDICSEIHRKKILDKTGATDEDILNTNVWRSLFDEVPFFTMFGSFIVVEAYVINEAADQHSWIGFIESRLRKLAEGMQKFPLRKIYTFPKKFEFDEGKRIVWYTGLVRHPNKMANRKRLDLSYEVKEWVEKLYKTGKANKEELGIKVGIRKWSELPDDEIIFPGGKDKYRGWRKVWIHRRKEEQEHLRKHPNGQLKRQSYAILTPVEADILAGKTIGEEKEVKEEAELQKSTEDIEDDSGDEQEENLLLTKRLREEEQLQNKKAMGNQFNFMKVPRLPGLNPSRIETYINK